jgi:hypothetical protein
MDGGSSLNIIYISTLEQMDIPLSKLIVIQMLFYGIILGKKAQSLSQISLEVVFGDHKNFWKENLTFEMVDSQSAYHAILGWPTYGRFLS